MIPEVVALAGGVAFLACAAVLLASIRRVPLEFQVRRRLLVPGLHPDTLEDGMAKGPEQRLKDRVGDWLHGLEHRDRREIWSLKVHGSRWQRSGVPDYLLCIRGRFVAIELKAPGEDVEALQAFEIARIGAAGGDTFVCSTLGEVQAVVEAFLGNS